MAKTKVNIKRIHDIADELKAFGLQERVTSRIHQWANMEAKRLRNKQREENGKSNAKDKSVKAA